jgi:hypothetical protein
MCVLIFMPILVRASPFEYKQASLEIFWEILCSHSYLYIFLYNALIFITVEHVCFC